MALDDEQAGQLPGQDEADWLQTATRPRLARSTAVILALLIAALLLCGGMQIQKQFGETAGAAGQDAGVPTGGLPSGFPSGLPTGGAGGAGSGSGDAGGGGPNGAQSDGSDQTAVIGTVVRVTGDTVIVKDIGGTTHVVEVPSTISIQRQQNIKLSQLKHGEAITVKGTTDRRGNVDAGSLTVR
jgi:hypothetical protein